MGVGSAIRLGLRPRRRSRSLRTDLRVAMRHPAATVWRLPFFTCRIGAPLHYTMNFAIPCAAPSHSNGFSWVHLGLLLVCSASSSCASVSSVLVLDCLKESIIFRFDCEQKSSRQRRFRKKRVASSCPAFDIKRTFELNLALGAISFLEVLM
jgi:hypothetical protein